jgi:hypothetical protein
MFSPQSQYVFDVIFRAEGEIIMQKENVIQCASLFVEIQPKVDKDSSYQIK